MTDETARGQQYTYDLAGRRTWMDWYFGANTYAYNDFGAFDSLISQHADVYSMKYDLKGQIDSLILGTGVKENRVVQRYSYRSPTVRDGTWEEYWYDALGRRVLTRARRDPAAIYSATFAGPLCMGTNVCRSFTERVSWDGDQALVEDRAAEGTSDVSNNGVIRNIHGPMLDEPLALIADNIRIINYNWRGQAMSSVFLNGSAGDLSLGNTATEVDWPAATQAETYFAQSPDANPSTNPKRWLGTFVANGQGTTGMLYRRNRYFEPKSGQFTQADPTGIATGMNVFGFAAGDPINFSDPFGLCPVCDVADIGFFLYSAGKAMANPSRENLVSAGMDALGLLPLVPSASLSRRMAGLMSHTVNAAEASKPIKRIFSARVLERMADDPFHNFPQMLGEEIFAKGTRTVKSKQYLEYTQRGFANGRSGTYEIGVRPSHSGNTEVITHWLFRPDKN